MLRGLGFPETVFSRLLITETLTDFGRIGIDGYFTHFTPFQTNS